MRLNDELNNITFDEEEYFREYFKPMDIPEEAKKEREEASEDIFDLLLFMFLLIDENLDNGAFSYNDLLMEFQRRYADIIAKYGRNDAYFQQYLGLVPGEILDTTIKNLDNEYYTSEERAASVSANEANGILNYEELQRKIDEGYTHKTWKAEIDRKTRLDHDEMNGTTIPIEEYFVFPDCEMMMPHDEVNGTARQVVNCRCSLKYSSQQNRVENNYKDDNISDTRDISVRSVNYAKNINELTLIKEGSVKTDISIESIKENLLTSPIGKETKEFLEQSETNIIFSFEPDLKGTRGSQLGNSIIINMQNIGSDLIGAQTIIHETVHYRYDIGGCQKAEAICMAYEKMHKMGRDYILPEEWEYVKKLAIDNYGELQWLRGGYGDYSRFTFAND